MGALQNDTRLIRIACVQARPHIDISSGYGDDVHWLNRNCQLDVIPEIDAGPCALTKLVLCSRQRNFENNRTDPTVACTRRFRKKPYTIMRQKSRHPTMSSIDRIGQPDPRCASASHSSFTEFLHAARSLTRQRNMQTPCGAERGDASTRHVKNVSLVSWTTDSRPARKAHVPGMKRRLCEGAHRLRDDV